jgi:hypothetical protein
MVLAIRDQLLVTKRVALTHKAQLLAVGARPRGGVFSGLKLPSGRSPDAIQIWTLPEHPDKNYVFAVVNHLRQDEIPPADWGGISPNHIMMPSSNGDECPHGPPRELGGRPIPTVPAAKSHVPITVIDSGYQWGSGPNPLETICSLPTSANFPRNPAPAEWFDPAAAPTVTNAFSSPVGWMTDPWPEVPSTNPWGYLDALVGHTNFTAGVIAQHAPHPDLYVWDHNGSFAYPPANAPDSVPDPPLESSVCRSIAKSQLAQATPLIHVGFSFIPFMNPSPPYWVVSDIWAYTLGLIGPKLLVVPVGNQGTTDPRYPAALGTHGSAKVIGVASLNSPSGAKSGFSNYQDAKKGSQWVGCACSGENIISTFPNVTSYPQFEAPSLPHDFSSGWAQWSGTSFAAPAVTGEIAKGIASGQSAANAWLAVWSSGVADPYVTRKLPF